MSDRRIFKFDFELPAGVNVSGQYVAEGGRVEQIEFSDGSIVETGAGGWTISAKIPSAFHRALGIAVLERILRSPTCLEQIDQTKPRVSWKSHAPVTV